MALASSVLNSSLPASAPQAGAATRAVLVGVDFGNDSGFDATLDELALLAQSAGDEPVARVVARRKAPDAALFVGSGKADEIRSLVLSTGAQGVIFDQSLSPAQQRNLERHLGVSVADRTGVILDIFAARAQSHEGKLQVELARLQYLATRLVRRWSHLERQSGGIGLRGGPGEAQIELDRRMIGERIKSLKERLQKVKRQRSTQRKARERRGTFRISLVGYTNAGKSSLLNRLTGAGVLVDDSLFATLDPTVRKATTADGRGYTLADTVGFVRHLPHQLVEAFRSTLEEVTDADVVLHVVDGSDSNPERQLESVREVLAEIGAANLPEVVVVNKADLADPLTLARLRRAEPGAVVVSASTGEGIDTLRERIDAALPRPPVEVEVLIPYDRGDLVSRVHSEGEVLVEEHRTDGTFVAARVHHGLAAALRPF